MSLANPSANAGKCRTLLAPLALHSVLLWDQVLFTRRTVGSRSQVRSSPHPEPSNHLRIGSFCSRQDPDPKVRCDLPLTRSLRTSFGSARSVHVKTRIQKSGAVFSSPGAFEPPSDRRLPVKDQPFSDPLSLSERARRVVGRVASKNADTRLG